MAELDKRLREDPVRHALARPERHLLRWQRPLVALTLGLPWDSSWGPAPTRPPRVIVVVAANQVGKSTAEGLLISAHATGHNRRFQRRGEIWCGMPRLRDSVATQRPHVERWLGTAAGASWSPTQPTRGEESTLRTRQGWIARLKAFEQHGTAWESGTIQAAYLDEPPEDWVIDALRVRTMAHDGFILSIFTPILEGLTQPDVDSELYRTTYLPWCEYRERHPGAKWGEVAPGVWVFSVGARDNARSAGGYLPDERIDADEAALIAAGRELEARVRYGGEWLDTSADRIIPVERLGTWSTEPRGGFLDAVIWVDPAYSIGDRACEKAIAVAALGGDGKAYIAESRHGRWGDDEFDEIAMDVCRRWPNAGVYVQPVPGDRVWASHFNRLSVARLMPARVRFHPESGAVPDKLSRAREFATMVSAGQVLARPEFMTGDNSLGMQCRTFTAEGVKRGIPCDTLDAAMGAVSKLLSVNRSDWYAGAVSGSGVPRAHEVRDEPPELREWLWADGRRDLLTEVD